MCERGRRDRLPYPLTFQPPGDSPEQRAMLRAKAIASLEARVDERMVDAFDVLLDPDVRIEVYGFNEPNLTTRIRMHAGSRRGTAVLATQFEDEPGEGGDVIVRRRSANIVASDIVNELPATAAGKLSGVRVHRNDLAENPGNYLVPANEISVADQARQFFGRQRDCAGEVRVYAGPAVDWRTEKGRITYWIDFAGDGRYLLKRGSVISAKPATTADLSAEIERAMAAVVRDRSVDAD